MSSTSTSNPLQFNLRHLLVAMLLIAIASALAAPWLRDLTSGQWLRFTASLGLTISAFLAISLLHGRLYLRAKRQLGPVRWVVCGVIRGAEFAAWLVPVYFLVTAALAALLLSAVSITTPKEQSTGFLLLLSLEAGVSAAIGVQWLRCPLNRVLVGENGILSSTAFYPWKDLWSSWEKGKPTPLLVKTSGGVIFELDVPAETEQAVAEFLQSNARAWKNPWRPKRS